MCGAQVATQLDWTGMTVEMATIGFALLILCVNTFVCVLSVCMCVCPSTPNSISIFELVYSIYITVLIVLR